MSRPLEYCCECDEPTGHAGAGDGSLYTDDGVGPYCDSCFSGTEVESKITPLTQTEGDEDERINS